MALQIQEKSNTLRW